MAGDWIKMRHDLRDDPACLTMSDKTSDTLFGVVGRLHAFWSWADRHTSDGRIKNGSKQHVDALVDKQGFADAMVEVGWLVVDGNNLIVPQFARHNGNSSKARSLESEAKRLRRSEQKPMSDNVRQNVRLEERREENTNKRSNERAQTPKNQAKGKYTDAFEDWYRHFPRKKAKGSAAKAFNRAVKRIEAQRNASTADARLWLNERTALFAKSVQGDDPQYIPYPASWLNADSFNDDVDHAEPEAPTRQPIKRRNLAGASS